MFYKGVQVGLAGGLLVTLAACGYSSAPVSSRVVVALSGEVQDEFTATDPQVFTRMQAGHTTILARGDDGDYSLDVEIGNPLRLGTYAKSARYSPTGDEFSALVYVCAERPGCKVVASSSAGSLTLTRVEGAISGNLVVTLTGLDGSNYGMATATFTVPPAQVVP